MELQKETLNMLFIDSPYVIGTEKDHDIHTSETLIEKVKRYDSSREGVNTVLDTANNFDEGRDLLIQTINREKPLYDLVIIDKDVALDLYRILQSKPDFLRTEEEAKLNRAYSGRTIMLTGGISFLSRGFFHDESISFDLNRKYFQKKEFACSRTAVLKDRVDYNELERVLDRAYVKKSIENPPL